MSIFLAKSVPPGNAWKEIMWGLIISIFAYFTGYVLFEIFRRGPLAPAEAVKYACYVCMIIALAFFLIMRFPFSSAVGIAAGVGLVVLGSQQPQFLVLSVAWTVGLASIVRGFSTGPRRN